MTQARHVLEVLDRAECLRLLGTVPVGRFVFTTGGLPEVQPVNFVVDRGHVLFRTREGAKLVAVRSGTVVAFEADEIDPASGTGWSVTVVGEARILDDDEAAPYRNGAIDTWAGGVRDEIVSISTPLVSGRRVGVSDTDGTPDATPDATRNAVGNTGCAAGAA